MNQEKRDQRIQDLMVAIRRHTQPAPCIDVFERLLKEIPDKEVVDTVLTEMHNFSGDFLRLGRDVDNMVNLDFKARILTREFIKPETFFKESRKIAQKYLLMSDVLTDKYYHQIYENEKKIMLPNVNCLGDIYHKKEFTPGETVEIARYFGDLSGLTVEEVKEKYELARKVILLYNYLPAIVKAFIQTKRRGFNLDRNSTKFE